jgi:hypothetical protein
MKKLFAVMISTLALSSLALANESGNMNTASMENTGAAMEQNMNQAEGSDTISVQKAKKGKKARKAARKARKAKRQEHAADHAATPAQPAQPAADAAAGAATTPATH